MIQDTEYALAATLFREGRRPSEILRTIALLRDDISPPDLMDLAVRTFGADRDAVRCIGGWWHDGSAELSDEQLDRFLSGKTRA
ncbi:MAG: hypothetical protein ACYC10_19005 [Allorhizobium sp.]